MRSPRIVAAGTAAAAAAVAVGLSMAQADSTPPLAPTSTPIKHVVVIFNENESFDHYFGTYPNAANPPGEPKFDAAAGTPAVNGLGPTLLDDNPNASLPQRLDRSEAVTCSQNHGYNAEQGAFDGGLMDKFVEDTAGGSCSGPRGKSIVMDYYDGNTVTALWNLAQHFSMSDNSYGTNFGPSTVGALNLISGETHGTDIPSAPNSVESNTVIGDPDPKLDDCASGTQVTMSGKNVGDLLNAHHVSWGWFEGGFRPTSVTNGTATCASAHANVAGGTPKDYVPHHEPFEYYASTTNQHHLPPSSPDKIGLTDQANHQYDLTDFDTALAHDHLPSVSFLKPAAFEDGHPSNSDPLDEQRFIARALDALEASPEWSSTAVIIAYDDSDGWYDHQMSPIVNPSAAPADQLNGAGACGHSRTPITENDRCGYGPRQPLLVISPYAKQDFVDHSLTDQTSILRFIEDNWQLGQIGGQSFDARAGSLGNMFDFDPNDKPAPKLFLDPTSGLVLKKAPTDIGPLGTAPNGPAPTPTPTATSTSTSGTSTVSGTVGDAPAPRGAVQDAAATHGAAAKIALSCTTRGGGRKVTISCSAEHVPAGATALRFRIVKGARVLATAATRLSHGRAKVTLKSRRPLKGRFTLRIAISHAGGVAGVTRTIRLG